MSSASFTFAERIARPLGRGPEVDAGLRGGELDRSGEVLLGESAAVRQLRSQIQRIAPYFRTALIRGEAGTGKQAVARRIHALSPGAEGPFVVRDACDVAEAAGRGEARGSPCAREAVALLDEARGGTLYLTRVGELSFSQQAALFRFIRRCDERRGGARIVAATDRDLRTLAAIGQFRQDMCARLSGVEILAPPLRQRVDDVPVLAEAFLRRIGETTAGPRSFDEAAMALLREHRWAGNLRELEAVVAQAAAQAEDGWIGLRHLAGLSDSDCGKPLTHSAKEMESLQDVIERHVHDVLTRCGGNKLRAAEMLGISRSTLYRMLGARAASVRSPE